MMRKSSRAAFQIMVISAVVICTGGWFQRASPSEQVSSGTALNFPPARFPLLPAMPQSWDTAVPYAREAYENKLAFAGYGLGLPAADLARCSPLIIFPTGADPVFVRALIRVNIEHHTSGIFLHDYEVVGVSRKDAEALEKFTNANTAEKGFMGVSRWLDSWPDPKVPQNWLKASRPDLYALLYPTDHILPADLEAAKEKLTTNNVGKELQTFLQKHPEVNPGVFWGSGDWNYTRRALGSFADLWLGPSPSTRRWVVMSEVSSYPDEVWRLSERKTIELIADVDQIQVSDPEGTNLSWEISEEMAKRWAKGAYERGHIVLSPNMATGRFARSDADYPASTLGGEWIPRAPLALAKGVLAGTAGPNGFFPRIEIHFKDGYVSEVVGGGTYGDLLRAFLKYPKINSTKFPNHDRPGWFYLYEVAMGTHPKFVRDPDLIMIGDLSAEGMRAGVLHFGVGLGLENDDPGGAGQSLTWRAFSAEHNLPADPGFHLFNYFATYRVHLRKSNRWVNLIDRGRMTSLDDIEVRALALRFGDPDILSEDWIPEIPGINAPGQYEDYARDPWKYSKTVVDKVLAGNSDRH
jgi:hypothetical protein